MCTAFYSFSMAQQKRLSFTVNGHLRENVQNKFNCQMNDMYILHHFKRNKKNSF